MRSLSLLLVGLIGATEALRTAMIPEGPWDRFFPGRQYYEEEEDEDEGPSGLLTKVLIGAGVAAAGGAGAFAARVISARRRGRPTPASPLARSSPLGDVQYVKGGKSEAKTKPVGKGAGTATMVPPSPQAADAAGVDVGKGAEGEEEKEEEVVYEVEDVLELDDSKLTAEQKAHPLAKLLGPKLVRTDEQGRLVEVPTADALKGKTVGLFFHSHQIEAVLKKMKASQALPMLTDIYKGTKDAGNNFEMVFVGLPDGQEGAWQHYVKQMPWLAVPHGATEELYRKNKMQTFPSVMVVDEHGEVLNDKGFTYMSVDKAGFPWKKLSPAQMIGDKFVDAQGDTFGAEAVSPEKAKVLALYFSASWCKPCREFTPRLTELYNKLKAEGKELEVVLVSLDEEADKAKEYLSEMPWLAVSLDDTKRRNLLMAEFEVRSLPTLLLLDEERKVITARGREFATKDPEGAKFPWRPEPLNEVNYSIEGIGTKPAVLVFMEGASSEAQEQMVGDLQRVAEEFAAKAKDAQPGDKTHNFGFYYAKELTTITKALRGITNLQQLSPKDKFLKSKADVTKPVLVLLDIANERCHVSKTETIDEASIRALVAAQLKNSLSMEPFKQPEPAAGADAAGAA